MRFRISAQKFRKGCMYFVRREIIKTKSPKIYWKLRSKIKIRADLPDTCKLFKKTYTNGYISLINFLSSRIVCFFDKFNSPVEASTAFGRVSRAFKAFAFQRSHEDRYTATTLYMRLPLPLQSSQSREKVLHSSPLKKRICAFLFPHLRSYYKMRSKNVLGLSAVSPVYNELNWRT